MNNTPNSSDTSDREDDDYEVIGIRQTRHFTSFARRYSSLTIHDVLDLKQIKEQAESLLSIHHILDLLTILTMTLITKLVNTKASSLLSKMCHVILAFLAIIEDELDLLTRIEVDICALRVQDRPPLRLHPTKIGK